MTKIPPLPNGKNLQVAAHLSCDVIRVALLRILELCNGPKQFIDSVAELLDAAFRHQQLILYPRHSDGS